MMIHHPINRFERKLIEQKKAEDGKKKKQEREDYHAKLNAIKEEEYDRGLREYLDHVE